MLDLRVGRYPHTGTLFSEPLSIDGEEVAVAAAVPGLTARNMMRELAYDICELPLVNYLSAREIGIPLVALPVFLSRRFPQPMVICNSHAGIETPRDLEGRRVGIGYYGNTDTTWVQVMLTEQFGVDCDRIRWVASQGEQVPGREVPANVMRIGEIARTAETDALPSPVLGDMLRSGEIDAVVYGLPPAELGGQLRPLLCPVGPYELAWWRQTGVFPILHTLVIREPLLRERPELPQLVYDAFVAAKSRAEADPTAALSDDELRRAALKSGFVSSVEFPLGGDPMPYGLEANRANLELLVGHAAQRGVIDTAPNLKDVFLEVC